MAWLVNIEKYNNLPKELSNLHRFMCMVNELYENNHEKIIKINLESGTNHPVHTYLDPLSLDYWSIKENVAIYNHIKNSGDFLAKRCFIYLKQIKYLHRDVQKLTRQLKQNKELYINAKKKLHAANTKWKRYEIKLNMIEQEEQKKYMPEMNFEQIHRNNFFTDIIENHYNEFKSKNICYDFTCENPIKNNNYSITCKAQKTIIKSILGFLNADGGNLYLGIEDDGQVTGIKFYNREHLDQLMKHIDSVLINIKPLIIDKFYDYAFWKVSDAIVVHILVSKQKRNKKRYKINGADHIYVRNHSLTRKIKLENI